MKLQKTTKGLRMSFSLLLLLTGLSGATAGQPAPEEVAIKGYDAVTYFTAGKPLAGNEAFAFPWHGMTWYFSSKENKALFAASPEKYAPQYDGYCAWALTESRLAKTDPEVWKIVDGKLYLNCSQTAYEKWSKDIPGNIKKANAIWQKLGR